MGISTSVVIATYNGSKYIREQLNSILKQTCSPGEIIVVDDRSSDATLHILYEYKRKNQNIKIIQNKANCGVKSAFEIGLGVSTGDIVFLSDQDDVWEENKIERFLAEFRAPEVVCVLANLTVFFEGESQTRSFFNSSPVKRFDVLNQFIRNDFIGCNMAVRKCVLEIALPFPNSISMHDWWLAVVALKTGFIRYLDISTMSYRRHHGNVTTLKRRSLSKILKSRFGNLMALFQLRSRLRSIGI